MFGLCLCFSGLLRLTGLSTGLAECRVFSGSLSELQEASSKPANTEMLERQLLTVAQNSAD